MIFDEAMILPEYLVSFDYIIDNEFRYSPTILASSDKSGDDIGGIGGKDMLSDQELVDHAPFLLPLMSFVQQLGVSELSYQDNFGTLSDIVVGVSSRISQRPILEYISEEAILAETQAERVRPYVVQSVEGPLPCSWSEPTGYSG